MQRLDTLVGNMESEQLSLETLLATYEEGVKLVKVCQGQLTKAQQRLEIIQTSAAQELEVTPFAPAEAAKPETARPSAKDVSLF